jgi:hypothetical protein
VSWIPAGVGWGLCPSCSGPAFHSAIARLNASEESVYLFVVDNDKEQFNILGPLADDRPWLERAFTAQREGRSVRTFIADSGLGTLDALAADYTRRTKLSFTDSPLL